MAYSNTRYTRYRHSPKLITPIQPIPKIQDIESIQTENAIQPIYPYQGLDEKRRTYLRAQQDKQTQTFLANYNDPTELNSFIDALTNREAVSKKFGETWGTISTASGVVSILAFAGSIIAAALAPVTGGASLVAAAPLAKVGAIAAIPSIPAAMDVTIEKGIKPIVAGKPKEALLNTMMNFGETMDFVANPVKGLIKEGGEGFIKGLGLSKEGRVNYDYATGFFLTDMLLETVSDPMNWVTLGTTAAFKTAAKPIAKEATQQIVENTVHAVNKTFAKSLGEISIEGAERISKQVTKTATQVSREWATASFDTLTDAAKAKILRDGRNKIQQSLVRAIKKELPKATASEIDIILRQVNKSTSQSVIMRSIRSQIQDITFDTLSSQTIKGLVGMQHYSNTFEKFMTKGAMLTSGYGLGVEAAKNGWKGIKHWANNITLNRLKKASVFDNANGLDIKQWKKAKGIWEASYKYVTDLSGDISQRDMNAFYAFANQQFNRDKQLISKIMQDGTNPLKKGALLDGQFQAIYGCDFIEYIAYLKGISASENGIYDNYIKYLESTLQILEPQAIQKGAGEAIKAGQNIFSIKDVAADNIIQRVQKAIKTSKNKTELTEKFYTLKMNNAYVNSILIHDKNITEVLMEINGSERIGALLDKINGDLNALAPEVAAQIPVATQTIKEAGASFMNIKNFYNEVAGLAIPNIKGVPDFRKYVIDQIFGVNKPVSELLAEFDSITMPSLKNGLETMLYESGFKFSDYPALEDQIVGVYRRFLEAQQSAGVEMLGATIVQDFTKSIDDLIKYLPQYADELQVLEGANLQIKTILAQVKNANLEMLDNVLTDKNTIFNVANTRQLADVGLALKTVAIKDNLNMFELTSEMSGNIINSANKLGKSINRLKEQFEQYHVYFDTNKAVQINNAYIEFRKQFLDNPEFTALYDYPAFKYLKNTTDPIEQFAHLVEFNKTIKDRAVSKQFKDILQTRLGTVEYLNVLDPSGLMVTDFAWDAMAQSAWIAEKQLNETIINGITAYKNLSLNSKKITADFEAIRDVLSINKLDRPKMLQQERYIKAASKINDMLEFLEQHYASRFNSTLAAEEINTIRNVLINFPELNEKYSGLVDTLEAYWRGEKTFQQSPKSMKDTDEFVDEFTPFWEAIKTMNQDIQKTVAKANEQFKVVLNERLTEAYAQLRADFKKQYKISEMTSLDLFDNSNNPRQSEEFLHPNIIIENQVIHTQQGETPVHIWERRHTTDTPYADVDYYADISDLQKTIYETYNEKYRYYKTYTHEYYKDLEYAQSRQQYRQAYEDTAKVVNKLKQYTLEGISINSVDSLKNIKEIILRELATESEKGISYTVPELYELYAPILDNIFIKYTNELEEAIKYANDYSAWKPRYTELKTQFYNKFSTHDQKLLKQIENAKSTKQAIYLTQTLPFSTDFKNIMHVQMPANFTGYKRWDLQTEFQDLINRARGEKFNKDVLNKITEELRQELGDRNKAILKQRFEPIREKIYKQTLEEFNFYKYTDITPWDPVKEQQQLNKLINNATDANAKGVFYNLFSLTPEEFINELAYRKRFITFTDADINDAQLKAMFNKFKANKMDGVKFVHQDGRHWIVLDKTQKVNMSGRQVYLNDSPIMRLQNKKQFNEFKLVDKFINDTNNPGITKTLNELDDALETLTGSRLGDSQGEYLSKETLQKVYNQMPDEVKALLPEIDEWTDKQFFDAYIFNESILGTAKSKAALGMYSGNMITNTRNAITQAQAYLKPKNEYVNTVFDSQLSIASPNSIWVSFSDQDILEALQANPEYKLVALVDDKKWGMRTREILPTSVKAIQKAKELGAVIIPMQTYKDMYNVVNHRLGSTGMAKLWSRIMYVYKFGYLCRPGAWIRNFIDTNIKSKLEMGDEFSSYKAQAHKILDDVDNMKKFISSRDPDGLIKSEAIAQWFADGNAKYLTYEEFLELDRDFLSQGISGNVMRDLYAGEAEGAWRKFTEMTGNIIDSANKTEDYNRLATYLYELDHGADYTSALAKIAKTHFDYSFKTKAEQLAEMVFPFTTFSLRNYSYWAESIEKHPWLMRNYVHLMKPHWDFKDYTPQELARDYRVQTQILYGQLKLGEFNNKVITFKANPSIQDAIQMFSDPINAVYEKLAAPISVPLKMAQGEYTQPTNLLPVVGPMLQALQTMKNTGTPLPSAIGVSKAPKRTGQKPTKVKFANKNLSKVNTYRDKYYRRPRYTKNVIYDSYSLKGIDRYRVNLYPVIDIAHDVRSRYSVNVYNRIKSQVQTDVYQGIRYRLRLDANRFR